MAVNSASLKLSAGILMCMLLFQMSVAIIRSRRNSDTEDVRIRQPQLTQLRSWNCGTPKPRLVYLLDEHKNLETTSIVWIPNAAILHRCEAALAKSSITGISSPHV
ncbi:unnamed protein product [Allacma fusca]|uniref:Uncharacterized protein n=1 Tax=Allacma fusca TaxID=39272 RepID=A0A8J2PL76_9HEXA|nr:unnamed protein product [Allacma fusca]